MFHGNKTFTQLIDGIERDGFAKNSLILTFTGLDEDQHFAGRGVLRSKLNLPGEGKEQWATIQDALSIWPGTTSMFKVIVIVRYEVDGIPCPRVLIDRILDAFGTGYHVIDAFRPREAWWTDVVKTLHRQEDFLHYQGVFTLGELRSYAAKPDKEIVAQVRECKDHKHARIMLLPDIVPRTLREALAQYDAQQMEGDKQET